MESKKKKPGGGGGEGPAATVDPVAAEAERITARLLELGAQRAASIAASADLIVGRYRAWERSHPREALNGHQKLEMVLLGFAGDAGFLHCHEPHRLPWLAFFTLTDRAVEHALRDDPRAHSEALLCPAMASGRCEGIWRAQGIPPCQILLLEILRGLELEAAHGAVEEAIECCLDQAPPDAEHLAAFARARELVEHYERLEALAEAN